MEEQQHPQPEQAEQPPVIIYDRPPLDIDLQGPDGNVFMVIAKARQLLEGEMLARFNNDILEALQVQKGTTYRDVLALVNRYTDLLDTSGRYEMYSRETHVTRAVQTLNDRLTMLPRDISEIGGIYPEFDNPDLGPSRYGHLVLQEMERVEAELTKTPGGKAREDLLVLRAALWDCALALHRAGV